MAGVPLDFTHPGIRAQFADAHTIIEALKKNEIKGTDFFQNKKIAQLAVNRFANRKMNNVQFEMQFACMMRHLEEGTDEFTGEALPRIAPIIIGGVKNIFKESLLKCAQQV